jgi:hypothetical protein
MPRDKSGVWFLLPSHLFIHMLVFIDDSGDPGFKLEKGSTRYFVVLLLIFDDETDAEKATAKIKALKQTLNFSENEEFKFHKSSRDVRVEFLRAINDCKFKVHALIIDKTLIQSEGFKSSKTSFYSHAIQTALERAKESIFEADIWIDGGGGRIFKRNFTTYLRQRLNTQGWKIVESCRIVDSRGNTLIQMADMIAGAIRRSHDSSKNDHALYKSIIKKHIVREWHFENKK